MPWKHGNIKLDDGSVYPADFLLKDNGEVWNVKIYKEGHVIEEIDVENFARKLSKRVEDVYPFTYEID